MGKMEFETMTYTNKGGRQHNEDFVGYLDEFQRKAWVVADGLGRHSSGEIAARTVGETVLKQCQTCENIKENTLQETIQAANRLILERQRQDGAVKKMRTTLVAAQSDGEKLYIGNVGNSKLYYFRDDKVMYVTPEQSEAHLKQTKIDNAYNEKQTQLLGYDKKYEIDEKVIALQAGDAFLLCSDGFWKQIDEMEMLIDLNKSQTTKEWIKHLLVRLISRAKGKYDNYTVCGVIVR